MGKLTVTAGHYRRVKSAKKFDALLLAWRRGDEVTWVDLMTAWIKTPLAPQTRDTVLKLIGCLKRK